MYISRLLLVFCIKFSCNNNDQFCSFWGIHSLDFLSFYDYYIIIVLFWVGKEHEKKEWDNYKMIEQQTGFCSTTAGAHPATFLWAWWTGQMKSFKAIKGRRNEELPESVLTGASHRARMKHKTQRERAKQMRNNL